MARSLHLGSVIPPGLVVDYIEVGAGLTITARPKAASARCPMCDEFSSRVHSRYTRTLSDLPAAGRRVAITISVRRFRSVGPECRTKVFVEAWLSAHPAIAILARDRGGCYGEATARTLLKATQVADRCWGGRPPNGIAVPS
jgi:hypothetical protein